MFNGELRMNLHLIETTQGGNVMRLFIVNKRAFQRLSAHTSDLHVKATASERTLTTTPFRFATSTLGLFDHLKHEERRRCPKKRMRFDYESNQTVALALPFSDRRLSSTHDDQETLLAMSEKYIIEHANRRVDLFFYTLIAYYHTNVIPIEGHTTLQYGIGRTLRDNINVTQACHSSLIPSLIDETIYRNGHGRVKYKSLLSGTHFMESLNSTMELPPFVNAFDDLLESICRAHCMEIIQDVSVGKINPIQGLTLFLEMMNTLLDDFKQQATAKDYRFLAHPSLHGHPYVNPKLIDLVAKGTLNTTFSESRSVNPEYVQLLLRMTPAEKLFCQRNPKNEKIYFKKMMDIREEILVTESEKPTYTL